LESGLLFQYEAGTAWYCVGSSGAVGGHKFQNIAQGSTILNTPLFLKRSGDAEFENNVAILGDLAITGTTTGVSKGMVGLGNCDDTADLLKPVSTAMQTALNLKSNIASPTFTGTTVMAAASATTFEAQTATLSSSLVLLPDTTVNWGNYTIPSASLADEFVTLNGNGFVADATIFGVNYSGLPLPSGRVCCSQGLLVVGGITLENNSVADSALSLNIPKLDAASNVFTGSNTMDALVVGSTISLPDNSISDSNLSTNIVRLDAGTNVFTGDIEVVDFTATGTLSLPNQSIANGALQSSVVFNSNPNTFAATQTFTSDAQFDANVNVTGNVTASSGFFNQISSLGNLNVVNIFGRSLKRAQNGINLFDSATGTTSTGSITGAVNIEFTGSLNTTTAAELAYLNGASSNIQTQLGLKADSSAVTTEIATAISDLVGGAGPSIDTLLELNTVLAASDSSMSASLTTLIGTKAPLANPTFTGTVSGVTKAMVGLTSADDTSDAGKPVSTAQQTALNLKANLASPTFTGTVSGVTKAMVGLTNADDTSDAAKPVSTAQQTALNLKANASAITNIDNTSDANKPISTAVQNALNVIDATDVSQQTALDAKLALAGGTVTGDLLIRQQASTASNAP
jgi:hypothetical protein